MAIPIDVPIMTWFTDPVAGAVAIVAFVELIRNAFGKKTDGTPVIDGPVVVPALSAVVGLVAGVLASLAGLPMLEPFSQLPSPFSGAVYGLVCGLYGSGALAVIIKFLSKTGINLTAIVDLLKKLFNMQALKQPEIRYILKDVEDVVPTECQQPADCKFPNCLCGTEKR